MLIEVHLIQNHSPANLNRDDLGAPKTCFFGGVLRSRISSQCLKRSIRMSDQFQKLLGGVRTRQLAKAIAGRVGDDPSIQKRAEKILGLCGIKPKKSKKSEVDDSDEDVSEKSKMLVYSTWAAIEKMAELLRSSDRKTDEQLAKEFGRLISSETVAPDMALCGRMLETGGIDNTTVEGALQAAHAISTHEARPEVDYYVAADDLPGSDAGAGYVDEAMFSSACFYKYFSINWERLVENLRQNQELAAHTVGAFMRAAALSSPSGKQNSFAAHNPPDGILVEIKHRNTPMCYANAFAKPAKQHSERDIVSQSIAQLGQYIHDIDTGYGKPQNRLWFSPNLRYALTAVVNKQETMLASENLRSLDELVSATITGMGYDWIHVQDSVVNNGTGR